MTRRGPARQDAGSAAACYAATNGSRPHPNALAWAVKPAEEGIDRGIVLRIWNMSDNNVDCTISSDRKITRANVATHIETDGEKIVPVSGKLPANIGHNRIQTFRLFTQ